MKSQCALEGATAQVENRARAGYRSFRVWKFVFNVDTYMNILRTYIVHLYLLYTDEEIEIVFTMHNS